MVIATSIATTPMRAPEVTDGGIVPRRRGQDPARSVDGAALRPVRSMWCATPTREAHLKRHNRELAQHYRAAGRARDDASWTHEVDARCSVRPRDGLRAALARLGFDFR
jgi:hypothetical protein